MIDVDILKKMSKDELITYLTYQSNIIEDLNDTLRKRQEYSDKESKLRKIEDEINLYMKRLETDTSSMDKYEGWLKDQHGISEIPTSYL